MTHRQHGFTLLEMLVALSLTGLMLVLIGSALTTSNHTLLISEHYADRLNEMRTAQVYLRRTLQQTLPVSFTGGSDPSVGMFEGDGNHLRFVAALPSSLGTGIKIQTVELVDDGQGMKSLRVRFSQPSSSGERPWGEPQILMRRVANVRFSYRGVDDSNVPTDWLPVWPWSKRLPQLVRVEMDVEGQVKWPGMVVRVRTNMEPAQHVI